MGQEEEEADSWAEPAQPKESRRQRFLVFFHTKEVNSSHYLLFNLHTQIQKMLFLISHSNFLCEIQAKSLSSL